MNRVAFLAVLCVAHGALFGEELVKGRIQDKVVCRGDTAQSYALYIPSAYDPARKWPVLYAFDPGGRGREPLTRFQEEAATRGFLIACSYNSRNGPWAPIYGAAVALWKDTHARLNIDDDRVFATGFSGGARAAAIFSRMIGRPVAGVIACGAGLPEGLEAGDIPAAAYYGLVGTADFNYWEVMDLDKRLDRRADVPHWIRTFDGGHVWPPTPVCAEALNWIELVAAKRAGLTPDATLAEALVAKTAARAAALEAAGDVFRAVFELGAASSALAGIADTGELVGTAARLRLTDAFKHAEKKEAERSRKEEALMTGLYRTLSVLEKTVLMRRDLGEFLSEVDGLAKELKKAQDASDRDFTRRLLLTISVDSGDRGGAFLASKTPEKAVPCFEIAVRASIHDPARYKTNLYNLACAYARSGNVRFALDSLRRAVENGFSDRAVILRDTDLDAIKDRPEFQEILANIR